PSLSARAVGRGAGFGAMDPVVVTSRGRAGGGDTGAGAAAPAAAFAGSFDRAGAGGWVRPGAASRLAERSWG
ncbi:hypothetical protein, partial [Stenotrophomonas maltophilia]|uniref:hypothetical protein n=1 Tax=Stenotrophomonas maltophilia TaxID=40324 RepID=UPI0019530066